MGIAETAIKQYADKLKLQEQDIEHELPVYLDHSGQLQVVAFILPLEISDS